MGYRDNMNLPRMYVAMIQQVAANPPGTAGGYNVPTVLNTLGADPVYSYIGVGNYRGVFPGPYLTQNQTFFVYSNVEAAPGMITALWVSATTFQLLAFQQPGGVQADNALACTFMIIVA